MIARALRVLKIKTPDIPPGFMQLIMHTGQANQKSIVASTHFFITYHESHIITHHGELGFNLICSFYLKRVLCRYIDTEDIVGGSPSEPF